MLFSKKSGMPFLICLPSVSTLPKDGCGHLHKQKEPDGGTVEYLVWWLATRQNEAVCLMFYSEKDTK